MEKHACPADPFMEKWLVMFQGSRHPGRLGLVQISMSLLQLDFHRHIFVEFVEGSGLLVLARGLGLQELIVRGFIELYADPTLLVLALNLGESFEDLLVQQYTANNEDGSKGDVLFKVVNASTTIAAREGLYQSGGVISITSRILLMDLLKGRVPTERVSGILIADAHMLQEDGTEAFALELFRKANKTAFIKAFSDSAESFVMGWAKPDKALRLLRVKDLFVYPRFDKLIDEELAKANVTVNDYKQTATQRIRSINVAIADLKERCLKQIAKSNPHLEMEELRRTDLMVTGELAMMIRRQLRLEWHKVSLKSRQLVSELSLLSTIEQYLLAYDSVTFLRFLETLIMAHRITTNEDPESAAFWLDDNAAQALIATARERVFGRGEPEMSPKWRCVQQIVADEGVSPNEPIDLTADEAVTKLVLVMVSDGNVKRQLQSVLHHGHHVYLMTQLAGFSAWKQRGEFVTRACMSEVDERGRIKRLRQPPPHIDGTQYVVGVAAAMSHEPVGMDAEWLLVDYDLELLKKGIAIRTYGELERPLLFLEQLQPTSIILYDIDLAFIRTVEVHKTIHPRTPVIVSMLMYQDTTEEALYLLSLRREKEAFASLLTSKPHLLVTETEPRIEIREEEVRILGEGEMRKSEAPSNLVIVDTRDLRSTLPFILHKASFRIEPVTLEIGDYLLAPDICVERKSIPDLIGSLSSGRLFTQLDAMCRAYPKPVLLIEFDRDRPFHLMATTAVKTQISPYDLNSRLVLLLLHFPALKLIWSISPYETAIIFKDLKTNKPDPINPSNGRPPEEKGGAALTEARPTSTNTSAREMLLRMPGVSTTNVHYLMRAFPSMRELVKVEEARFAEVLGDEHGRRLHRFINAQLETSTID